VAAPSPGACSRPVATASTVKPSARNALTSETVAVTVTIECSTLSMAAPVLAITLRCVEVRASRISYWALVSARAAPGWAVLGRADTGPLATSATPTVRAATATVAERTVVRGTRRLMYDLLGVGRSSNRAPATAPFRRCVTQ
jgi:hypothetical protein